jgi:hypothetical protein
MPLTLAKIIIVIETGDKLIRGDAVTFLRDFWGCLSEYFWRRTVDGNLAAEILPPLHESHYPRMRRIE